MNIKFKKGDKVRVSKNVQGTSAILIGLTGSIKDLSITPWIFMDDDEYNFNVMGTSIDQNYLELKK